MITNADMTIYNYWYNPETREYEYRSTWIKGVHWHTDQKISVMEKGVVSAEIYKIRIPKNAKAQDGRIYVEPKLYSVLDKENVNRYWTVGYDDLFARGMVECKASGLSSLKQYAETGKIISYSVNNFGSSPHIRIGGIA